MAVLTGYLLLDYTFPDSNPAITNDFNLYALPIWPSTSASASVINFATVTTNYPISTQQLTLTGWRVPTFFDDFYNRIHLRPLNLALGNVVGDQSRPIVLWNAYLIAKTLNSVSFPVLTGTTLIEPVATPYAIQPLMELTYLVNVSANGPPNIDTTIVWLIPGETVEADVTGTRLVAWPFAPNWSQPMSETLDWLTDVIVAYNGDEQRRVIRSKPRCMFEYTSSLTNKNSSICANLLWGNQNRAWGLPLWFDRSTLTSIASASSYSIATITANKNFVVGGYAILITDTMTYEVVEIVSVTSSSITVVSPLTATWAAGTNIYPLVVAKMPTSVTSRKLTDSVTEIAVTFNADPVLTIPHLPLGTAPTSYNEYEVVLKKPNWAEPLDFTNEFEYAEVDYQTGGTDVFATTDYAKVARRFSWLLRDRTEIIDFRKLLGRLKGRAKPVYIPTWLEDFELYAPVTSTSSTELRVVTNEFYRMVSVDPALNTIMMMVNNSPVFKTIQSVTLASGYTSIVFTTAIGITISSANLQRICLMHLCRFTTDRVTINYLSDSVATVDASFTLVKS